MAIESIIIGDLIRRQSIAVNFTLQLCKLVFLWNIHEFETTSFAISTFIFETNVPCCSSAPFEDFPCRLELLLARAFLKVIFTLAQ